MNLKLLCLLFDSSLMVQQTNTCRGSSALLKFQSSFYFSAEVCLFSLLLHFQANTNEKIIDDQKLLHPFLDSPLADLQTDFCRERSATVKFYDCSCFQTRSDSSAYSSVSVLKLMGQIFVAYENTTFPLAFPTCRATNRFL